MASDAFTGADDTPLATHDANWASMSGFNVATSEIGSNQCRATAAWTTQGAIYTASTEDVSQIVVKAIAAATSKRVHVRAGASTQGYSAVMATISGGNYTAIALYKNAVFHSQSTGKSIPIGSDHTLKITASGTSTVSLEVFVDGVSEHTTSDSSSPIGAGNPGFSANSVADVANTYFDDWTDGAGGGSAIPVFMNQYRQRWR